MNNKMLNNQPKKKKKKRTMKSQILHKCLIILYFILNFGYFIRNER